MSKFDTIFTNNRSSTYTGTNSQNGGQRKYNSFVSRDINNPSKKVYDYKETEFPDLTINKTSTDQTPSKICENKKYSDITSTVNEVKIINTNPLPPGWIQYSRSKTKNSHLFEVTYGEKTKRQIEQEEEDAKLSDPAYINEKIISTLVKNWTRYKKQYDEINGEGSYDLIYYTEPVYAFEDDDNKNYNNEYNYNYDSYDSQEEYIYNNADGIKNKN